MNRRLRFITWALLLLFAVTFFSPAEVLGAPNRTSTLDKDLFNNTSELNTRGGYIALGAKYLLWKNLSLTEPLDDNGDIRANGTVKIKHKNPIYYQISLGSSWNSSILRFRYDTEFYFGSHKTTITASASEMTVGSGDALVPQSVNGKLDVYGVNFNFFYDAPTFFNSITPYFGVSGIATGLRLKLDGDALASSLYSPASVIGLLGSAANASTKGFNLLYGYGFIGGARWEIASVLAIDTSYRLIRFNDCVQAAGCNLIKQDNVQEFRVDIVLRF